MMVSSNKRKLLASIEGAHIRKWTHLSNPAQLDLQISSEVSNSWLKMMERSDLASDIKHFSFPSQRLATEAPCKSAYLGCNSSFDCTSSSEENMESTITKCRASGAHSQSSNSFPLHTDSVSASGWFINSRGPPPFSRIPASAEHHSLVIGNTHMVSMHHQISSRSAENKSLENIHEDPSEGFLDVSSQQDNNPPYAAASLLKIDGLDAKSLDLSLSCSKHVRVKDQCIVNTAHIAPKSIQPDKKKMNGSVGEINFMGIKKRRVEKAAEQEEQDLAGGRSLSSSVKLSVCSPENSDDDDFSSSRNCSTSRSSEEEEEQDGKETDEGLQLVSLLLKCATLVAKNHSNHVVEMILEDIFKKAGPDGDAMQRLSLYFAESLAARLVLKVSPLYKTLMPHPTHEQVFKAFAALHKISPCFQFAHFTSNQAIMETFEGHQELHIIDIDMSKGFQWASLLQSLASRHGGPPSLLRLTGIGRKEAMLRDTAQRLSSFAESLNIRFEFEAIVEDRLENLSPERFNIKPGEAIAVNCVFELHRLLNDESGERIIQFLSTIRRLSPHILTVVEQEANHNAPSFLGRFIEALHYYAAIFDSLDASFPRQSVDRLNIEQIFFARQIRNIVACEDTERLERHEKSHSWRQRMENAGFQVVNFSEHATTQAKLLLQYCPCDGYRLTGRDGMISLGWQDRPLITASAWTPLKILNYRTQ